jgi:glycosyltransferase involved in cell wall biosynthesis
VELWVVGEVDTNNTNELNQLGYQIRVFNAEKGKKSKYHFSKSLVTHARQLAADFHILKGIDGGIGTFLLKNYLLPAKKPFAFIIGGDFYSTYVPEAQLVFYETQRQKQILQSPGFRFWRKKIQGDSLIRMPKFINTQVFCPMTQEPKKWDILVVGRLIPKYKNYDALGLLSRHFRVAVAGNGPEEAHLRELYPKVDWLGYIPNPQLPQYYNQAQLFMHTGLRDYFPRVIAEAMACGLPCIALEKRIKHDVLPDTCGLLVQQRKLIHPILTLLKDKNRLQIMGQQARQYALEHMSKKACKKTIEEMFLRITENNL